MLSNKALLIAAASLCAASLSNAQVIGPSTTTAPYLVPNASLPAGSVQTVSILTAGDSVGGYRMCGTPDGLGVIDGPGHTFQVVMNHEFGLADGVVRAHGATGAFVSRWVVDACTLGVISGRDHNTSPSDVYTYDRAGGVWNSGADAWDRFCSGDVAAPSAYRYFFLGTPARIFLTGEETRPPFAADHGRGYASVLTGFDRNETWELPALGRMAFENAVASPFRQIKTIVIGCDDADRSTAYNPPANPAPSELYMYVGVKRFLGNTIRRAGLTDGHLFGTQVRVNGTIVPTEDDTYGFGDANSGYIGSADFTMHGFGNVSSWDGNVLQSESVANGVFRMARTEDGAWDPRPGRENDFYFVTTASTSTNSRLFRLRFDNIRLPQLGGTVEILLDGSEGHKMLDNISVDSLGRVVMTEDVGSDARLGKVWVYDIDTTNLVEVAAHDGQFFGVGGAHFLTTNEEASGVVPAFQQLGVGWYLIDVQAHLASADPELVEGGQLLALYIDPTVGN